MLREGAARRSDWPPRRALWPINFPFLFVGCSSLPPSPSPELVVSRRWGLFYGPLKAERGDSCGDRSDPLRSHGFARTLRGSGPSDLRGRGCLCARVSLGDMGGRHPLLRAHADTVLVPLLRTPDPSAVSEDRTRTAKPRGTSQVVSRSPAPSGFPGL